MNWQMHYDETDGIIYTKATGVLNKKQAEIMRKEGVTLAQTHTCLKGLLDYSTLEDNALTTVDIYNIPKVYSALGVSHRFKLALVVKKEHLEAMKFYETVCRNNGYPFTVFADRAPALAWLNSETE